MHRAPPCDGISAWGRVGKEISCVPCTLLIAMRYSGASAHTCPLQESSFIMETSWLLLLLNNPQPRLSSHSPHLFFICGEEIEKLCWRWGGRLVPCSSLTSPAAQQPPNPGLCLHFTFTIRCLGFCFFFFLKEKPSRVNLLTSLFHLTHLETCVTADVSALSNLFSFSPSSALCCAYPIRGGLARGAPG